MVQITFKTDFQAFKIGYSGFKSCPFYGAATFPPPLFCDVETLTASPRHMEIMAATNSRKRKQGGDYCVAGGPNKVSCKNNSYSECISMHYFPKDEIVRKKWTNFVQKHRKNFVPSNKSCLCSAHFDKSCYENRPIPFVDLPYMDQPPRFQLRMLQEERQKCLHHSVHVSVDK